MDDSDAVTKSAFSVWGKADKDVYSPNFEAAGNLLPGGVYKISATIFGSLLFSKQEERGDVPLRFPGDMDKVLREIQMFWERRDLFASLGIPFRRGILVYGPPGTGKTTIVRLAINDVKNRGGIGLIFDDARLFSQGYKAFRQIQPSTPLVVAIEDLERFTDGDYDESQLLDLLDGHTGGVKDVVFIATTNYIDQIPDRIKNRPSRFDRKVEIGLPGPTQRSSFVEKLVESLPQGCGHLANELRSLNVHETDGLSFAHLKELFTAVVALGTPFEEALASVKSMVIDASVEKNPDHRGRRNKRGEDW